MIFYHFVDIKQFSYIICISLKIIRWYFSLRQFNEFINREIFIIT